MKVQCSCGAKYEFEITPAMASRPVQFICPACARDASDFVDSLVRNQLGQNVKPAGTPVLVAGSLNPPMPLSHQPRLTVVASPAATEVESLQSPAQAAPEGQPCLKHPGQVATGKCYICSKPICPKCMELFGYVCSPLCKAKAGSHGIEIPIYEGQKSVKEARIWRKVVWLSSSVGVVAAVALGFWFWYAWFGSIPKSVFSVRFPDIAYAGQSALCGERKSQLVFIHGNILARYDLSRKREVWSVNIIDSKKFTAMADEQLKAMQQRNVHLADQGVEELPRLPSSDKMIEQLVRAAEEELVLHVRGENIWVVSEGNLVRYDWNSGKPAKEMAIQGSASGLIAAGDELMAVDTDSEKPTVTHINLANCDTRTEPLTGREPGTNAGPGEVKGKKSESPAGLPVGMPGRDLGRPMDPAKVAQQAQHMSLPARLALPATIANSMTQERSLAALNGGGRSTPSPALHPQDQLSRSLIPSKDGFIELSVTLLESRIVERSAMKPATGKSALDGNLTAGASMDAASEMLNEMQKSRGGDVVQEDLSRYRVTIRPPHAEAEWSGEVVGPPRLLPLETVNILVANKTIVVLDKSGKKMWESSLAFNIPEGFAAENGMAPYGLGPCVERGGSLYVFDQAVLTVFDLKTGNARWRLPSVGITGVFFDDHEMMYVNTTTASPEKIKYSRQIDLAQQASSVVLKVDSRNGRILWTAPQLGLVNYVSGKIVLTVQSYQPDEEDSSTPDTGFETPPYLRIRRLNPGNGHELWEHFQQRCPLDIGFDKSLIRLVFKKEVQVLKFLAF